MMLYCTKCGKMNCLIGELVCDDCKRKISFRCSYCGKPNFIHEGKIEKVWVNGDKKELWFCKDGTCASYYQMGAEG